MTVSHPPVTWSKVISIVWLPILVAIAIPATIQVAFRRPQPHERPIAAAVSAARTTPTPWAQSSQRVVRSPSAGRGTGIFLLVLPLMMAGGLSAVVLRRRPAWGIGRRAVVVAGVGAAASLVAYLSAVELQLLPDNPLLLACAFLVTQLAGAPSLAGADPDQRSLTATGLGPELRR